MRWAGSLVGAALTLAASAAMGQGIDAGAESPAAAQAPHYQPPPVGYQPPPPPSPELLAPSGDEGSYSPAIAGWTSNLATFLPMAGGFIIMGSTPERGDRGELVGVGLIMVSLGAVVGPGVGHMYAGELGHGFGFAGLRLLSFGSSVGLGFLGAAMTFGGGTDAAAAPLIALGGAAGCVGLGLMLYDLVDAADAARRSNREEAAARRHAMPRITVSPTGAALGWSF